MWVPWGEHVRPAWLCVCDVQPTPTRSLGSGLAMVAFGIGMKNYPHPSSRPHPPHAAPT